MYSEVPPLVAPPRFAAVERGVYRSAYPTLRHLNFLRTLDLKTIVSLSPEEPTLDLREFCRAMRITLRHVPVDKYKGSEVTLLPADVSQALEVVLNQATFPVLVHCLDGRANTGTVVLVLRRLLMWSTPAAQAEYCRFTRDAAVPPEVTAFVAEFAAPVTLAPAVPRWLWGGSLVDRDGRPQRHPTMRVRNPAAFSLAINRAAPAQDAALVVKLLPTATVDRRAESDVVELGGEMRMLECVSAGAAAAQRSGMGVVKGAKVHDRRGTETKPRSRSADSLRSSATAS
jgi:tyrosine-protein phosphatase OCA6